MAARHHQVRPWENLDTGSDSEFSAIEESRQLRNLNDPHRQRSRTWRRRSRRVSCGCACRNPCARSTAEAPGRAWDDDPMPEPYDVAIRDRSIRLGQFLKLANLVESGAEAKPVIQDGQVSGQRRGRDPPRPSARPGRAPSPSMQSGNFDFGAAAAPRGTSRWRPFPAQTASSAISFWRSDDGSRGVACISTRCSMRRTITAGSGRRCLRSWAAPRFVSTPRSSRRPRRRTICDPMRSTRSRGSGISPESPRRSSRRRTGCSSSRPSSAPRSAEVRSSERCKPRSALRRARSDGRHSGPPHPTRVCGRPNYACWAIQRYHEHGDPGPRVTLSTSISSEEIVWS